MRALKRLSQDFFAPGRRLGRFFLLVSIKESYLLLANSLGLILHPFATIAKLQRTADKSQMILLTSLLGWTWLGILFFTALTKIILPRFGFSLTGWWQTAINIFLLATFFFLIGGTFWLAYWVFVFFKARKFFR